MSDFVLPADPILREVIPAYEGKPENLTPLAKRMAQVMVKTGALGLAAPQIGERVRMISIGVREGHKKLLAFCINPVITARSKELAFGKEGCMTFPGKIVLVRRHKHIHAQWTDVAGKLVRMPLSGLAARVFQHEADHLEGICIIKEELASA